MSSEPAGRAVRVCALVGARQMQGLELQTRRPDDVLVGTADLARALAADASWFWLLEDFVVPEPSALEALLGALEDLGPLPRPPLLAGKVLTPNGLPAAASLPVVLTRDADLNVAAYERRLVRVRIARRGSLLVHRQALEEHGLPGRHDILWSARVLRSDPGLLVPASVAVRGDEPPASLEALQWCRLLLSGALMPAEKPWLALRLLENVVARARRSGSSRRPASVAQAAQDRRAGGR